MSFVIKNIVFIFCVAAIVAGSAVLVTVVHFSYCDYKNRQLAWLAAEENISDEGRNPASFFLCTYPDRQTNSRIEWIQNQENSGKKILRLVFKDSDTRQRLGIHFNLSLLLCDYVHEGMLQFFIKVPPGNLPLNSLGLFLKEGPSIGRIVFSPVPVSTVNEWQQVNLPLSSFELLKEEGLIDENFSWQIDEILFTSGTITEILVKDIRFIKDGKIILDFS